MDIWVLSFGGRGDWQRRGHTGAMRPLVRRPEHLARSEQAEVIGLAKICHQLVDVVIHRNNPPGLKHHRCLDIEAVMDIGQNVLMA